MSTFKMRIVRPQKHVLLEMTDGGYAKKGKWKRLAAESNSSLLYEAGEWEQSSLFGTPDDIRLYDPVDTPSARLKNVKTGQTQGTGAILLEGFGGAFGDGLFEFEWFRFP